MTELKVPADLDRRSIRNTLLVALMAVVIATFAMWRMDFLFSPRSEYVRMTDSARNAYVAKNVVEGRGYVTNEIPAALVGFYEARGMLHDETWPNADRFPFTTFAIAGLYVVTGSTAYWVGITLYNILAFTILIVLIYRLSLAIFGQHYSALLAVTIALLHHGTYNLLYQKDADSVALTVGALLALVRWLDAPRERRIREAPILGTVLAWLFLARPNVGLPFVAYFLIELLAWIRDRDGVTGPARTRLMVRTYGALAGVFLLWTTPYAIYSWLTWGSPFFSANSLYQLPLGTRLSLGGDTWWKYYGPERTLSFMGIFTEVPGQILWKVVTSWVLTFRLCLSSYIAEIGVLLAAKLTIWNRRSGDRDPLERPSVRVVRRILLCVVIFNLVTLPLFGWAWFPWKQYLVFAMPMVWIYVGHALYRFAEILAARLPREVGARFFWLMIALIVLIVVFGLQDTAGDGTFLTPSFTRWAWANWQLLAAVLAAILLVRPRRLTPAVATVLAAALVLANHQPSVEHKSDSLNYFPLSDGVAKTLRERKGLVSSLALQSEVAWLSGRRHVPVPENALRLYEYHSAYGLTIEDVYLESAQTMVTPPLGPFHRFMPALESYARLERYQARLPGYSIVFHEAGWLDYKRYKVGRRKKSSTIYRLTDPAARDAIQHSPDAIALASVDQAIHLTHGFGGYYQIDGRNVVAQTEVTRMRYKSKAKPPAPWEDASISFFLRDRMPKAVTVSFYAARPNTFQFYWNLDLDAYDVPGDRPKHLLTKLDVDREGWQTITLPIPAHLPRVGLNKLGVRSSSYLRIAGCLASQPSCAEKARDSVADTRPDTAQLFPAVYADDMDPADVAAFFESLQLVY